MGPNIKNLLTLLEPNPTTDLPFGSDGRFRWPDGRTAEMEGSDERKKDRRKVQKQEMYCGVVGLTIWENILFLPWTHEGHKYTNLFVF